MPVSRQEDLRSNQKERTRQALVDAASALLREGSAPSVADAAANAKVSRATAYRYFPTQEALLTEIIDVSPAVAPIERLVAGFDTDNPERRVLQVVDEFNGLALAEEAHLRAALRVYLDTWLTTSQDGSDDLPVREGRRMRWIDQALGDTADFTTPDQLLRLRAALALTLGIESIVTMRDVCHLDDQQILETLHWTAATLLRATLEQPK